MTLALLIVLSWSRQVMLTRRHLRTKVQISTNLRVQALTRGSPRKRPPVSLGGWVGRWGPGVRRHCPRHWEELLSFSASPVGEWEGLPAGPPPAPGAVSATSLPHPPPGVPDLRLRSCLLCQSEWYAGSRQGGWGWAAPLAAGQGPADGRRAWLPTFVTQGPSGLLPTRGFQTSLSMYAGQ